MVIILQHSFSLLPQSRAGGSPAGAGTRPAWPEEAAACLENFETERAQELVKELSGCACEGEGLRDGMEKVLEALDAFDMEEAAGLLAEYLPRTGEEEE